MQLLTQHPRLRYDVLPSPSYQLKPHSMFESRSAFLAIRPVNSIRTLTSHSRVPLSLARTAASVMRWSLKTVKSRAPTWSPTTQESTVSEMKTARGYQPGQVADNHSQNLPLKRSSATSERYIALSHRRSQESGQLCEFLTSLNGNEI